MKLCNFYAFIFVLPLNYRYADQKGNITVFYPCHIMYNPDHGGRFFKENYGELFCFE